MPSIVGHTGPIYAFAISPEEDLIVTGAGNGDPTIRLWTFPTGEPLGSDLYEGRVHDIEYSPSHRQVAISGTQPTVWLWEVDRLSFLHLIFGARVPTTDLAYSSRGNGLVMVTESGVLQYQRVPSVFEQRTIRFEQPLTAVAFSGNRLYIACGDSAGRIYLVSVP
jgi:WD40 repeat protein